MIILRNKSKYPPKHISLPLSKEPPYENREILNGQEQLCDLSHPPQMLTDAARSDTLGLWGNA